MFIQLLFSTSFLVKDYRIKYQLIKVVVKSGLEATDAFCFKLRTIYSGKRDTWTRLRLRKCTVRTSYFPVNKKKFLTNGGKCAHARRKLLWQTETQNTNSRVKFVSTFFYQPASASSPFYWICNHSLNFPFF